MAMSIALIIVVSLAQLLLVLPILSSTAPQCSYDTFSRCVLRGRYRTTGTRISESSFVYWHIEVCFLLIIWLSHLCHFQNKARLWESVPLSPPLVMHEPEVCTASSLGRRMCRTVQCVWRWHYWAQKVEVWKWPAAIVSTAKETNFHDFWNPSFHQSELCSIMNNFWCWMPINCFEWESIGVTYIMYFERMLMDFACAEKMLEDASVWKLSKWFLLRSKTWNPFNSNAFIALPVKQWQGERGKSCSTTTLSCCCRIWKKRVIPGWFLNERASGSPLQDSGYGMVGSHPQ